MIISLKTMSELSPSDKVSFLSELELSMDVPFGKAKTVAELIAAFDEKLAYWIIMVDGIPVGLFGFTMSVTLPQRYQTSSLILKAWRGKGIGPLVKIAAAQTFLDHGTPLISCVREWNAASVRSLKRAFPEITPEKKHSVLLSPSGEKYYIYVFNLSMVKEKEIPVEVIAVAERISVWLILQNKQRDSA